MHGQVFHDLKSLVMWIGQEFPPGHTLTSPLQVTCDPLRSHDKH